jgi:hypothetical protein
MLNLCQVNDRTYVRMLYTHVGCVCTVTLTVDRTRALRFYHRAMNTNQTPRIGIDPIHITWRVAGAFYWALAWRVGLLLLIPAGVRGFFVGYYHPEPFRYDWQLWLVANLISIPCGIWILKRILTRGISGYRLVVKRT